MNRDIFGFFIGLGAGVGLGMLLAPRSGERTRSLVKEKASDGAAYLRKRGAGLVDDAADAFRDSTRKVTKGAEAVKAAVEAGKRAYGEAIQS
jgi:gas vesicle protein